MKSGTIYSIHFILSLVGLMLVSNVLLAQVESKKFQRLIDSMYTDEVERICVEDAEDRMNDYFILDTRSIEEYGISHIENAHFADYESFNAEELDSLSREQEILVYCSIGVRSEEIGKKLQEIGFNNVYNLEGGIFEWKNQGMTVTDVSGLETDSIHVYSRLWGYWLKKGIKVY